MSSSRELTGKNLSELYDVHGAPRGAIRNAPHDDLLSGAIAKIVNAHCYPTEFRPRLASYLYSELEPPRLLDDNGDKREGVTASKVGTLITTTTSFFTELDVGNYFVWPNDGYHDQIIAYVNTTQVRTRDSGDRTSQTDCWIHGKINVNGFHKSQKKKFWLWGNDLYVADSLELDSQSRIYCASRDKPSNVISGYDEIGEYSIIANSKGFFKVDWDTTYPLMWKMNTPVPAIIPSSVTRTDDHRKRYDYTYSVSRLSGTGLRDRTSQGVRILQESGTCALNPNSSPPRDYAIRWREKKIGIGSEAQGRLVGATMAAANQTPDYWRGIASPGASFSITINDRTESFLIDFSDTGYQVTNMKDVASAIETEMRKVFQFSTCDYHNDGYFIFTSGEENGSTIGWGTAGSGGTDVSAIMLIRDGDGGTRDNGYPYTSPNTVGPFYVPKVPDEPTVPEPLWTHYTIYRTTDIGPDGVDVRVNEKTGEELPPLTFTWVADVRISAAFFASRTSNGTVTAHIGEFSQHDVGSVIEWEDGERDLIKSYVNSTTVETRNILDVDYYDDEKGRMAAAIGNGIVIRASQTGNLVTIISEYNSNQFVAGDVGKTIYWSVGYESVITKYISSTEVEVHEPIDKVEQGITFDSTYRQFKDRISDDTLRNRQAEQFIGLLGHRFWVSMPNANIVSIVPGFMLSAARGKKEVPYCQLSVAKGYLAGYYLANRQVIDNVQDEVQQILAIRNSFIIVCANTLWGGLTNNSDVITLPEFGEAYSVIYADILDEGVGIKDIGSIQRVSEGLYQAVFSDGSVRQFTDTGIVQTIKDMTISPETQQDMIRSDLDNGWPLRASAYSNRNDFGYVLWQKDRP